MCKVLVTGATGFIGQYLVRFLEERNYSIRVLVRDNKKSSNLSKKVEVFFGDVKNPLDLDSICDGIDIVFHLAGYAHAWSEENPKFAAEHHCINYLGTKNIVDQAIFSNVKKFIYFSSVKAVADSENCIDENFETLPTSAYGISKNKAEKIVLNAKNKGIHVCVLRPALVYGPGWKGNLDTMFKMIHKGLFPPLPKINNSRSMVSVYDICNAALIAAENPNSNGCTYLVTDGQQYSTFDIFKLMSESLGRPVPNWCFPYWFFKMIAFLGDIVKKLTHKHMPFDSEALIKLFGSMCYNSDRITKELDFKVKYNFKQMLPEIVEKFKLSQ